MSPKFILTCGLIFLLFVIFFDGGVDVGSPVSSSSQASFTFDNSSTTVHSATIVGTQILTQVNIYEAPVSVDSHGVSLVNVDGQICQPLPGEEIYSGPDVKGACFVRDASGQKFFINARGDRWPLVSQGAALDPNHEYPLSTLVGKYLEHGGVLPWGWRLMSEASQIGWLRREEATWQ